MDSHSCLLCGTSIPSARQNYLYGMPACRRCCIRFRSRRQSAFIIDFIITTIASVIFPPLYFYLLLRDSIRGSSLGKYLMGLQVIEVPSGRPCGFGGSIKRNLPLFIPLLNLLIIIFEMFKLDKGPRTGDIWANTLVIPKRSARRFLNAPVIADFVLEQARKAEVKGDFQEANAKCQEVLQRWPKTDAAKDAESLIGVIQRERKS